MEDEILVQKAKNRDSDAFTALMKSQMQSLYRTAMAILMNEDDAADAIQETMLVCWEKLKDLKEDRYFRTWMTRILIRQCYDMIKRNQRITYTDVLPEKAEEQNPTGNIEWQEAMKAIDEKYRIVLILYYAEGFRTKEIAKMLKISESTVRTRLSRGRKQLEHYYSETEERRKPK